MERFYTVNDQQTQLAIGVFQGQSRCVENNIRIGGFTVTLPPDEAGRQSVDVRYTYDINGILEVEVTTNSTGSKLRQIIEKNPGSLSPELIEARLAELQEIKIHPRERTENRLFAKGERLYEEALGEKRDEISALLSQFESMLATQDEREIKKAALEFKKQLLHFDR